jgi:hypothetical protein
MTCVDAILVTCCRIDADSMQQLTRLPTCLPILSILTDKLTWSVGHTLTFKSLAREWHAQ